MFFKAIGATISLSYDKYSVIKMQHHSLNFCREKNSLQSTIGTFVIRILLKTNIFINIFTSGQSLYCSSRCKKNLFW